MRGVKSLPSLTGLGPPEAAAGDACLLLHNPVSVRAWSFCLQRF